MATKDLKLHVLTSGTTKIGIKEPDKYSNIATTVGVKLATSSDKLDNFATVGELKLRGKALTLNVRVKGGKVYRVICAIEKAAGAIAGLIGKSYGGVTIEAVSIPRKRTRR